MTDDNKFLYKYLPASLADVVFTNDNDVTLKFAEPKDFNDPYELFLATDFGGDSEMLACYAEAIGEMPQYPTTCFSKSPVVIPMWAHYAFNQNGFVIEFSEEDMREEFKDAKFKDVDYKDGPAEDFSDLVARVLHIGKPRYTYFLRGAVINAAYFTKSTCWNYEQERRMVVGKSDVSVSGGLMLMNVPGSCVSSIICGARVGADDKNKLKEMAVKMSANFYEVKIGTTSAVPYFVDIDGKTYSFINGEISLSVNRCSSCSEPTRVDEEECIWCQITEETKFEVAMRNSYRMIDSYGGLEKYIEQMNEISRSGRSKK